MRNKVEITRFNCELISKKIAVFIDSSFVEFSLRIKLICVISISAAFVNEIARVEHTKKGKALITLQLQDYVHIMNEFVSFVWMKIHSFFKAQFIWHKECLHWFQPLKLIETDLAIYKKNARASFRIGFCVQRNLAECFQCDWMKFNLYSHPEQAKKSERK